MITGWLGRLGLKRAVAPAVYMCSNDHCDGCLVGFSARQVVFGCFLCKTPPRFADLGKELQRQLPMNDLSELFRRRVICSDHVLSIAPRCPNPACGAVVERASPIGIWSPRNAGKTVFCAALMLEIERQLRALTGIVPTRLFDRVRYGQEVVEPLRRDGLLPAKTLPGEHRTLVLSFTGEGSMHRRLTLTDMAGETYDDWFDVDAVDDAKKARQALMFRAREAIFLADPEAAPGLGARARRDPFPALVAVLETLDAQGFLSALDARGLTELLARAEAILEALRFPVPRAFGERPPFERHAAAIAQLVDGATNDTLRVRLANRLQAVADQMSHTPTLESQVEGLMHLLAAHHPSGIRRGRLDLRLAVTITKADLLPQLVPDYDELLTGVGRETSRREWRRALKRASEASREVLRNCGEEAFVDKIEAGIRDVGFFFVSSAGRDTEAFVQAQDDEASAIASGGFSPLATAAAPPLAPVVRPTWKLGKRLSVAENGTRHPSPQHVLLPLLWILMGDA